MKGKEGSRVNLDFDINSCNKNTLELLDCQVELILQSLEFSCYTCNFMSKSNRKSKTKEENSKMSLITDTYNQILEQYNESRRISRVQNKNVKKFA